MDKLIRSRPRGPLLMGWILTVCLLLGIRTVLAGDPLATAVPAVITSIATSPSPDWLATGGDDHAVRLWDARTYRVRAELRGHTDWVHAVTFGASDQELYSAGADGKVFRWNLAALEYPQLIFQHRNGLTAMVRLSSERLAVCGFSQPVQVIDLVSLKVIHELPCPCRDMRALAVSPDGEFLAAGGRNGKIRIWSTRTWVVLRDIPAHDQRLRSLVFSADGRLVLSGGEDRTICGFDVATGSEACHITGIAGKVMALAVVGEDQVAAACSDNQIHLWDLSTGRHLDTLEGHTGSVSALAPWNGGLLSGGFDATVRFWAQGSWRSGEEGTPVSQIPSTATESTEVR